MTIQCYIRAITFFALLSSVASSSSVTFKVYGPDGASNALSWSHDVDGALSLEASAFRASVAHGTADAIALRRAVVALRKAVVSASAADGADVGAAAAVAADAAAQQLPGAMQLKSGALVRLNRADFEGAAVLLHGAHRALTGKKTSAARVAELLTATITTKRKLVAFDAAAESGNWRDAAYALRNVEHAVITPTRLQEVNCSPHYGCALKAQLMVRRVRALAGSGRWSDAASSALKLIHMRARYGNRNDLALRWEAYAAGLNAALSSTSGGTDVLTVLEMEGSHRADPRAAINLNQIDRYLTQIKHARGLVRLHDGRLDFILLALGKAHDAAAELQASLNGGGDHERSGWTAVLLDRLAALVKGAPPPPRREPEWLRVRADLALIECQGRTTHDISNEEAATMQLGRWYNASRAIAGATKVSEEAERTCARAIAILSESTRDNRYRVVDPIWLAMARESVGTLRLRMGDFEGAAVAYNSAMDGLMRQMGRVKLSDQTIVRIAFLHATAMAHGATTPLVRGKLMEWEGHEAAAVQRYLTRAAYVSEGRWWGRYAYGSV